MGVKPPARRALGVALGITGAVMVTFAMIAGVQRLAPFSKPAVEREEMEAAVAGVELAPKFSPTDCWSDVVVDDDGVILSDSVVIEGGIDDHVERCWNAPGPPGALLDELAAQLEAAGSEVGAQGCEDDYLVSGGDPINCSVEGSMDGYWFSFSAIRELGRGVDADGNPVAVDPAASLVVLTAVPH